MTQLPEVIKYGGFRVLTTAQMADSFGTNAKVIARNFQRNQEHYDTEEHYFSLSGEDLKKFKASRQNDANFKYASVLYLWTEKGAWLHAKSLNTDRAWQAYQMLIDPYYRATEKLALGEGDDKMTLALTVGEWQQVNKRLEALEMQIKEVTLHTGEQRRIRNSVAERIYQLDKNETDRSALFREIYSEIRERYCVGSYRDIKQHQLLDALQFIQDYRR